MAFDQDELNKRRMQREQRAKQRQARQRKQMITGLIAAAVVLAGCGIVILLSTRNTGNGDTLNQTTEPVQSTASAQVAETTQPEDKTVIHIAAAGDLNVTDKTVAAGDTGSGYDYTDVFMDVTPLLADADLTVMNFEGNLMGTPYGAAGNGSAPQQMMEALANSGVDLIQMANSCSINNGLAGLAQTLEGIRSEGMEPLGAYASTEEFQKSGGYVIRQVQGIRVAFVAFTKGMGNLGLPEGSEDCVNLLYTDYSSNYQKVDTEGITQLLRNLQEEEVPDVTIALLHWGSEYNDQISDSQEDIVDLMYAEGVDAIIGTHSHYVQEMKFDQENNRFLAYSLGDFFGDAERSGSKYSVILNLEITKDNLTGTTTITDYSYDPIFTQTGESGMKVVRLADAIAAYEADYIQRISDEDYESMVYARTRIEARIHPDSE